MSINAAVQELEMVREQLQQHLAQIDQQRSAIVAELRRVEEALSALDTGAKTAPRVVEHAGKYRPLWQALTRRNDETWVASFDDVEQVLGFPLPPSCRRHLPHWYGPEGSAVARAIHDAGWKATLVSLEDEEVTFRRQ
jgi:hypothetical protein